MTEKDKSENNKAHFRQRAAQLQAVYVRQLVNECLTPALDAGTGSQFVTHLIVTSLAVIGAELIPYSVITQVFSLAAELALANMPMPGDDVTKH